ncbi:MAG TPA: hypothetical protein IAC34_03180 [Candidatus Coprenecus stercoripullorum]|nr:hypothetical protein [Candidatus Coprenecus stercoripullorum]
MRTIILSCILIAMGFSAYAQDAVRGKVVDRHGNPIPGVKIEFNNGRDSVFSGLDGTFTLGSGAARGGMEAFHSGMKPARARISDGMTVTMSPETWWNREPLKHSFFISLQTGTRIDGFGTATAPSLGIMFGTVKRWGWYIRALTWLDGYEGNMSPNNYSSEHYGGEAAPGYWWTTGRTKKNHTVLTIGAIARLGCALHLYFGAGLALIQDLHELADGRWVTTEPFPVVQDYGSAWKDVHPYMTEGAIVADLGLMLRIDFLMLNIGTSYFGNVNMPNPDLPGNWTLNAGVGFIF